MNNIISTPANIAGLPLLQVCGLLALALSAYLLATEAVAVSGLDYSLALCLCVALVTLGIAFLGCCGAVRESNCLLVAVRTATDRH